MKITLDKVKHAKFASEETPCFEAVVVIDGVPAFMAKNDGHGGPDHYFPLKGQTRAAFDAKHDAVVEYAKTLPETQAFGVMLPQTIETLVCDALDDHLIAKDLQGQLRRSVIVVDGGKCFRLTLRNRTKPADLTETDWQRIERQQAPAQILNRLPFETALALFCATALE